ncbi:MAG: hypothetical protein LBH85_01555 [Treponema sp.]|jgi:hypothetical protein|nr:hypothetical protein [Treponema sp.]
MSVSRENENELIVQILAYLDETHLKESEHIKSELEWLETLEKVTLHHPEIRDDWESDKSFDTLNRILASNTLRIPPRVMNLRNYLITKLHIFSTLSAIVKDISAFSVPLRASMLTITSFFTMEKVCSSCLRDNFISKEAKNRLADELVSLWDNGLNIKKACFFGYLEQLWVARDKTPPTYGTMDGNSELIRLSMEMPKEWDDFLKAQGDDKETINALLEFVFGLSYEDIVRERNRLSRAKMQSVNEAELKKVFGAIEFAYTSIKSADPGRFYDFFIERYEKALFRRRIFLGEANEAPKRTIEEIYLEHLVSKV